MLTVVRWRQFWFLQIRGAGLYFLLFLCFSIFCYFQNKDPAQWLTPNPIELSVAVLKNFPLVFILGLTKILGFIFLGCVLIHAFSAAIPVLFRCIGFLSFLSACVLRMMLHYPSAISHHFIKFIDKIPPTDPFHGFLNWLPFWCLLTIFVVNNILLVRFLYDQSSRLKRLQRGIVIEDLERESRRSTIGAVSIVFASLSAFLVLRNISGSFAIHIASEDSGQFRPHIFIFAIDSLRTDRLLQKEFVNVMPFLQSKLSGAAFAAPMLVGVPQSLPSWVEIASCRFAPSSGVRSSFPQKKNILALTPHEVTPQQRLPSEPDTFFSAAKTAGYSTLFVSDDRSGAFFNYPFGADSIVSPQSGLSAKLENSLFSLMPPLQAILVLPNLNQYFHNLQVNPAFADPRLLVQSAATTLNSHSPSGRPVLMTVFLTASRFPYSPPNPYHRTFGDKQTVNGSEDHTIAQYDGALRAIDESLKNLWQELTEKGWLSNSIVVVLGNHGENLFEGNLGIGHGYNLSGEFSTQTPLAIWTNGHAEESIQLVQDSSLVRSVDVGPTLAKRAQIPFQANQCDGSALLDINDKKNQFSGDAAYQETDIWTEPLPEISELLKIDSGMKFAAELRSDAEAAFLSLKERAWVTDKYRLIAKTSASGTQFSLFNRKSDPTSSTDLLISSSSRRESLSVATELTRQMNIYLTNHGVEIIKNSNDRFFYSENVSN